MLPYIYLGGRAISVYALCYAVMYAVIGVGMFLRLRRLPLTASQASRTALAFIFGLFAGTQVNVLAATFAHWLQSGEWTRVGHISAVWGMIVGVGLAALSARGLAFNRGLDLPRGRGLDLGVLPIPLGQAIGRLGCLAAGCCAGAQAPYGWGLPMPDAAGLWLYRYPTQPISAACNLLIFLVLLALDRRPVGGRLRPFDGFLVIVYVLLFCLKRFTVDFLRADYNPVLGPFSPVQLATLGVFAAALAAWVVQARK